jgi:hypothetical protein
MRESKQKANIWYYATHFLKVSFEAMFLFDVKLLVFACAKPATKMCLGKCFYTIGYWLVDCIFRNLTLLYKMANLLHNRRRCERSDLKTSWRHFSSVDVAPRKHRLHFSTGFIQKKNIPIPASCRFFTLKTDEISRTLQLMHNGITIINRKQP